MFVIIFTVSLFKFSGDHAQFFANFFGSSHQKLFIIMILLRQGNIMCILLVIFSCCSFILFISLLGDKNFYNFENLSSLFFFRLSASMDDNEEEEEEEREEAVFLCVCL